MRVCHFSSSSLDTHYFANLCKGISARGLSLLCGSLSEKKPPAWLPEAGAGYFCLDAHHRGNYPRAVLELARLLRKERVDVLQTHLFDASLVGVLAARIARTPVLIVTRHHLDQAKMIGTKFHVALDRWMARRADVIVTLSNAVRDYMISHEGLAGENIQAIHQGFDFARLSPTEEDRQRIRAELKLTDKFAIGCIGQLFSTKGQEYLVSALSKLVVEIPNVCILLVGGGDQEPLKALSSKLGFEDRVVFAGFRNDVAACMRAADIVVHPSLSEAFCQVLIEAMGVGTALITTDVGGAAEVVSNDETGLLIPGADSSAIAGAVLDLYRNPEKRIRIAAAGQASVRRRFTVERMVEQQIDCYRRALVRRFGGDEGYVASQI